MKINAEWDDENRVLIATSDEVTGLAIEASTIDVLIERLKIVIPELIEANEQEGFTDDELPFMLDGFIGGKVKSNSCR